MAAPNTSFNKRFANKKEELARSIRNLGISSTMEFYNIKSRQHFIRWLRDNLGEEMNISPLSGLSNGEKPFWYRQHRDFILTLLEIFDRDFVLKSLGMGEDALDRLRDYPDGQRHKGLTRLERAELDAKEALRLARETKKQIDTFIERFAIIDEERRRGASLVKEVREAHASFTEDVAACLGMRIQAVVKVGLDNRLDGVKRLALPAKLKITDIVPPEVEPEIDEEVKRNYTQAHPFSKKE